MLFLLLKKLISCIIPFNGQTFYRSNIECSRIPKVIGRSNITSCLSHDSCNIIVEVRPGHSCKISIRQINRNKRKSTINFMIRTTSHIIVCIRNVRLVTVILSPEGDFQPVCQLRSKIERHIDTFISIISKCK